MGSQVDRAVLNNIAWCRIVCDTHGINQYMEEHLWGLLTKAPVFYPEVITKDKNATSEDVKFFIENGAVTSIKDSYAKLDMFPLGFKILFEAEWISYPSISNVEPIQTGWREIKTEKELALWTLKSGLEDVIRPDLLKYKDVKIFIYTENNGVAGFIANMSHNVVGISNVFSVGLDGEAVWRDIPKIVSIQYPGISMVGYEHNSDLSMAHLSGWKSIGPLRVWIK